MCCFESFIFFFFNDTATTEIYTLSLHDALPICRAKGQDETSDLRRDLQLLLGHGDVGGEGRVARARRESRDRSEEHTSELQSQSNLVCRLLLEKKKKKHGSSNEARHETTHVRSP